MEETGGRFPEDSSAPTIENNDRAIDPRQVSLKNPGTDSKSAGMAVRLDFLPLPSFVVDGEGTILAANAAGENMTPVGAVVTASRNIKNLCTPSSLPLLDKSLARINSGVLRSATLSVLCHAYSGGLIPGHVHLAAFETAKERRIIACITLSPETRAQACRFSESPTCLADVMNQWLIVLDGSLGIRYSNGASKRITGKSAEELMGDASALQQIVAQRDLERLRTLSAKVLETFQPAHGIFAVRDTQKTERSFLWNLTPLPGEAEGGDQLLALVMDSSQTAAVQRKNAVQDSAQIFEDLSMGYLILDGTGRIMSANNHLLSQMLSAREDLVGRYFGDFLRQEDQKEFIRRFGYWLGEGTMRNIVFSLRRSDDSFVSMKVEGKVTEDDAGGQPQLHCVLMAMSNPATGGTVSRNEGGGRAGLTTESFSSLNGKLAILCDSYVMRAGLQRVFEGSGILPRFSGLVGGSFDEQLSQKPSIIIAAYTSIGEAETREIAEMVEKAGEIPLLIVCISIARPLEQEIIRSGARGLVTTENEFAILPTAALSVLNGELWCPRSIMQQVLEQYRTQGNRNTSQEPLDTPLTKRELEVLKLLAKALKNKEIADHLGVGYNTVVTHVYNIFRKLNITSRLEAMNYAMNRNLL